MQSNSLNQIPFSFIYLIFFMYQVHIFIASFISQTILCTFILLMEHLYSFIYSILQTR